MRLGISVNRRPKPIGFVFAESGRLVNLGSVSQKQGTPPSWLRSAKHWSERPLRDQFVSQNSPGSPQIWLRLAKRPSRHQIGFVSQHPNPADLLASFREQLCRVPESAPSSFRKTALRPPKLASFRNTRRCANRTPESQNRTGVRLAICDYLHEISTLYMTQPMAAEMQAT
jgi:hypothetical protein